jgi:flagellum-specific ATP synthase
MTDVAINFRKYHQVLDHFNPIKSIGEVNKLVGIIIESRGPACSIGELCEIYPSTGSKHISAQVVGFQGENILLMPFGDIGGIKAGSRVVSHQRLPMVKVSKELLGRVIDGLGYPLDGKGDYRIEGEYSLYNPALKPFERERIREVLSTGIRAIDTILTIGKGQKVGIFSGSGVGKSTTLGMIARNTEADVNVIALIGERGKEVREFIENNLGAKGLARSVVIAATSELPALVRIRAAFMATSIAEYFRDLGKDVLLMMDSVTRFAMAQREIGLAIGEPPSSRGYTPSVFTLLPKLMERTGKAINSGSITSLYTVLVEGDDINEPISDASRSILDGHIVLTRDLANSAHYPPIDILMSNSRAMKDIVDKDLYVLSHKLRELLATYKDAEDLVNIGGYVSGRNKRIDYVIKKRDEINSFLRQTVEEKADFSTSKKGLFDLLKDYEGF